MATFLDTPDDIAADMEVHMVADMEVDKVAEKIADMVADMAVDQKKSQIWPNFTIWTKFHNFNQISQFFPNL